MKNRKGFTLVELLAIIVILAVIMVIAVPQILNVVNGSKNGAWKNNVSMIERGIVKNANLLNPETGAYDYSIDKLCSNPSLLSKVVKVEDTNITCSGNVFTLMGTGQFAGRTASISCKNGKCSSIVSDGIDDKLLAGGLYDGDRNLLASWDDLVNVYGLDLTWYQDNKYDDVYVYISKEHTDEYTPEAGWYNSSFSNRYDISEIESPQAAIILAKIIGDKKDSVLVIPAEANEIPDGAFWGTSVTKVVLKEGITEIYSHIFYDSCIKEAILPDSLEYTGQSIFAGSDLQVVNIPPNLTSIEYRSFEGTPLKSVSIPSSVEYIGDRAFAGSSIESVQFSEGLTKIGFGSFEDTNLKSVEFPNTLQEIEGTAFSGTKLTSVFIPASVTSIESGAFPADSINTISVSSNNSVYDSRDNCNCIIKTADNELVATSKTTAIPSSVTSIGDSAYSYAKLNSFVIPSNITKIGDYAFAHTELSSIVIPNSVQSIGRSAFTESTIKSITIPGSVSKIGMYAFEDSQLQSITIQEGVQEIGGYAFTRSKVASITIPSTVTKISANAFWDCNTLTSATFSKTTGWKAGTTTLSSTSLKNKTTAANYLKETYRNKEWTNTN